MTSDSQPRTMSASRLEGYTDGVFAIAATLLVLDLTSTSWGSISSDSAMWEALRNEWPSFLAFGVSFALLSGLWVVHVRQFRDIARTDITMLWLNNARLLFIVLIPFTTSLVSEFSQFYAGRMLLPLNFFLAALLGTLSWVWAASRGGHLLREGVSDTRSQTLGGVSATICGAAAAALAPWFGSLAFLTYAFSGLLTRLLVRLNGGGRRTPASRADNRRG